MNEKLKNALVIELSLVLRWAIFLYIFVQLSQSFVIPIFEQTQKIKKEQQSLGLRIENKNKTLEQKKTWLKAQQQLEQIQLKIAKEIAPQKYTIEKLKSSIESFQLNILSANLEQKNKMHKTNLEIKGSYPQFIAWLEHIRLETPWVYVNQFKINRKISKQKMRRRNRRVKSTPGEVAIHSLEVQWVY